MIDNTSDVTVKLKKLIDYSFYVKIMPHLHTLTDEIFGLN